MAMRAMLFRRNVFIVVLLEVIVSGFIVHP
jgi:hypothetical protein